MHRSGCFGNVSKSYIVRNTRAEDTMLDLSAPMVIEVPDFTHFYRQL
jgi:hypothetical protein